MSLFKFNRTGLLTSETAIVLNALSEKKDWKMAKIKLFNSGYASSISRAYELQLEIKRRVLKSDHNLPNIDDLILFHSRDLSYSEKREINYVYLYFSDKDFQKMVDFLREIDNSSQFNQVISRKFLKNVLINFQKLSGKTPKEKTINNWIGKFISVLKDIKILVQQERNEYSINFGFINSRNWIFFSLDSYFKNINLLQASFLKPFNLNPSRILNTIKFINNPKITYNIIRDKNEIIDIKIDTKYKNLKEWISELK
ncbi:MAG: hypothetical protein ACTSVV_11035 [Promethearchaeota archaeon]